MKTELQKLICAHNPPTQIVEGWQRLLSHSVDIRFLEKWLSNAKGPDDLSILTDFLLQLHLEGVNQGAISKAIDNSPFSLNEWTSGIRTFYRHTKLSPTENSATHTFGYLRCCADAVEHNPIMEDFEDVITEMLEQYGYEGTD